MRERVKFEFRKRVRSAAESKPRFVALPETGPVAKIPRTGKWSSQKETCHFLYEPHEVEAGYFTRYFLWMLNPITDQYDIPVLEQFGGVEREVRQPKHFKYRLAYTAKRRAYKLNQARFVPEVNRYGQMLCPTTL